MRKILEILQSEGYATFDYSMEHTSVIKIDKFLENKNLRVEMCNYKMVWVTKKGFEYNMKLTLLMEDNPYTIDRQRYIYLSSDLNLEFLANTIESFILNKDNKLNSPGRERNRNNNEFEHDPYSEKQIMRDLMNGDGEKHGLG